MSDPRDENCRRFTESEGKVTGIELAHVPMPNTKYELIKAALIDESSAQGQTVARVIVKDKDGIDAMVNCWMAWPWKGQKPSSWDGKGLPGNTNYPYQHIITNKFNPGTQPGPLAIFIGDSQGSIDSDVVGGLGLPGGHHVGFHLVFRERSKDAPPVVTPVQPGQPTQPVGDDVKVVLQRIEAKLDKLSRHFGV